MAADVEACHVAFELSRERSAAFEEMKHAVEAPFTRQGVVVLGEKQLAHPFEIDDRLHLVGLLWPARHIGVARNHRLRAVGRQVHPLEMDDAFVHPEYRLHRRAHWQIVLNLDRAAMKRGIAAIPVGLRDGDVEVARDGAPGRSVILERHFTPVRSHVLHRGDERPPAAAAGVEFRKAVAAARPLLDRHLPVRHVDRVNQHLAVEHRVPCERYRDPLRFEERAIRRRHPPDDEILQHELAIEEPHSQLADAQRATDALRPFALGQPAQSWPKVDGQCRDDRYSQQRRQHHHPQPREAEGEVRSDALEALET